jgi:hypothetical protein
LYEVVLFERLVDIQHRVPGLVESGQELVDNNQNVW